jgi:hypothetical protein
VAAAPASTLRRDQPLFESFVFMVLLL